MTRLPVSMILGAALSAVFLAMALISFVWTPHDVADLVIAEPVATGGR